MNRILFALGVSLLLAGIVLTRTGPASHERRSGDEADANTLARELRKSTGRGSQSGRSDRSALSPAEGAARFRSWLEADLSDPPRFEEIDALAKRLHHDDLRTLIERAGLANMEGLVPWVRCALFAEWGRRDPVAAMAYLRDPQTEHNTAGWSTRQAWFSLFRGWAARDPEEALATLQGKPFTSFAQVDPFADSIESMMTDSFWQLSAYEEVFREWARHDASTAWEQIPSESGMEVAAMTGVFRGTEPPHERLALIERWSPAMSAQTNAGSGNPDTYVKTEALAIAAAEALAEIDLDLAINWIAEQHRDGEAAAAMRLELVTEDWAASHPELALERLPSAGQAEALPLARGILRTEPSLAAEALPHIDDSEQRAQVLLSQAQRSPRFQDFFPTPGRRTTLRDFTARAGALSERAEALSAAASSSGFSPEEQARLKTELDRAFLRVSE